MPKQIINVGVEPGNQGDGDSLRDAFVKTQANFDELYAVLPVIDTSLPDHSDPTADGTIAKALADTEAAGGGTVLVGPGIFNISASLTVGENVTLRGVGRRATTINMIGNEDCIVLPKQFGAVESLTVQIPVIVAANGISITKGDVHLKDIAIGGGTLTSWAVNVDSSNVVYICNVRIGGTGNKFLGNGIIFQNTKLLPINFGDSKLSKIDILLEADNTTGLKFQGPDSSTNRINNILCSQVEVIGTGATGGCIGVHLLNAARIVLLTVDLENLGTAVFEDGGGTGGVSKNNVYIATFVFGSGTSYQSSGTVQDRLFIGCDNLLPENTSDNDTIVPQAIWLNDGASRIWSSDIIIQFDDGTDTNGLQFSCATNTPFIRPASSAPEAQLLLGKTGSSGVECTPGVVLPIQSNPPANPPEGMLVYFIAGAVGANRGLYQYRNDVWVFIG